MSAHRDRRQFWRAHFERCQELGMTLKAYAEQEELTVSVFYGWSKRFLYSLIETALCRIRHRAV